MRPLHPFTRGGQLAVHRYRMLKQICVVTVLLSMLMGAVTGAVLLSQNTTPYQRSLYKDYLVAEFRVSTTFGDPSKLTQTFTYPSGRVQEIRSLEYVRNPWVRQQIRLIDCQLQKVWTIVLWTLFLTVGVTIGFFMISGYRTSRKKLERGNQVVPPKVLKRLIKKARQASDLTLDGLPLLKGKETSHILLTGTTGSGKTNCFHTLLPQIRRRPNRAIIVDLTGDYVAKYFREGHDLLLNPLDGRSQKWSPWGECLNESHYDALAAAIVPKTSYSDPFWENAGKALLSSALKELAATQDIHKLYHILVRADLTEFSKFFWNTDAATYTHTDGEKMMLSIRATLANHLQSFRLLKNTGAGFSIRKWVHEDQNKDQLREQPQGQWLFLSARPDQRETLCPLMSGWLDTAINALMSLSSELSSNSPRRLWFIIDELPALQELPSLEIGLAEARKYGGCFLAGVQSIPQIATTYGRTQSQAILDLFNTKIFFQNTDPDTTTWISKVLGEAETTENVENLSYGANTIRDGVNFSQQTRIKPLILPTQIGALQDCEAYLKLPSAMLISQIQMSYKKLSLIAPAFQELSTSVVQNKEAQVQSSEVEKESVFQEENATPSPEDMAGASQE